MIVEIKVPGVGESVTEATLAEWFKKDGDRVQKDEPLFVIETDKVTLEVVAEADGVLSIKIQAGETVAIGAVVGTIDTEAVPAQKRKAAGKRPEKEKTSAEEKLPEQEKKPAPKEMVEKEKEKAGKKPAEEEPPKKKEGAPISPQSLAPSVRNLVSQKNIDIDKIKGSGPDGRITRGDVLLYIERSAEKALEKKPAEDRKAATAIKEEGAAGKPLDAGQPTSRKPMSQIRRRIAARLVEAKQNTAMLTTFNEIDMFRVQDIRARYKDSFKKKHGASLGLMSFFIKATVEALKAFPEVNAFIDREEIVYHHYYHIGIAVARVHLVGQARQHRPVDASEWILFTKSL